MTHVLFLYCYMSKFKHIQVCYILIARKLFVIECLVKPVGLGVSRQLTITACEELELLAEREEDCSTDKLTLIRICMEGQEGLIRGYCQHDYRPVTEYIQFFPRSLRMLEFRTKATVLLHRF